MCTDATPLEEGRHEAVSAVAMDLSTKALGRDSLRQWKGCHELASELYMSCVHGNKRFVSSILLRASPKFLKFFRKL